MASKIKIALAAILIVVAYFAITSLVAPVKPGSSGPKDLYSTNWSGYLATSDLPFSTISSSWIVPSLYQSPGAAGYSSIWVGIGGVAGSNRLIQVGTEQDIRSDGSTDYYAWFEALPRPAVNLGTVAPGDLISVSISKAQDSTSTWHISLTKSSGGISSVLFNGDVQVRTNPASRASAEFIVEAPAAVSGSQSEVLPLANFQTISFSHCTTEQGDLSALSNVYRMYITNTGTSSGKILASPSSLTNDSFTVSREG